MPNGTLRLLSCLLARTDLLPIPCYHNLVVSFVMPISRIVMENGSAKFLFFRNGYCTGLYAFIYFLFLPSSHCLYFLWHCSSWLTFFLSLKARRAICSSCNIFKWTDVNWLKINHEHLFCKGIKGFLLSSVLLFKVYALLKYYLVTLHWFCMLYSALYHPFNSTYLFYCFNRNLKLLLASFLLWLVIHFTRLSWKNLNNLLCEFWLREKLTCKQMLIQLLVKWLTVRKSRSRNCFKPKDITRNCLKM